MIKCDEINKDGFLQIFEKLNNDNIVSFFPMTDYMHQDALKNKNQQLLNKSIHNLHIIEVY
jgi:hypothetical protein